MANRQRPAARAVLVTDDWEILLIRLCLQAPQRKIWITPGGGIDQGESVHCALTREIWDETGLKFSRRRIGPELWIREHAFVFNQQPVLQIERFFLVQTDRFEPRVVHLDDGDESEWFDGHHCWSIEDIPTSSSEFAPSRLGLLLRELRDHGAPTNPHLVAP